MFLEAPTAPEKAAPYIAKAQVARSVTIHREGSIINVASVLARRKFAGVDVEDRWRDVAMPAALGIVAHANRDWDTAIMQLAHALPRKAECGGSHAQRDLFEKSIWMLGSKAGVSLLPNSCWKYAAPTIQVAYR